VSQIGQNSCSPVAGLYEAKPTTYFANARNDIVNLLTQDAAARVLEIGCGAGGTGEAAINAGKAGHYVGVELDPLAAEAASTRLSDVICGNVEEIDVDVLGHDFDVLIISEVLEHLVDPWGTLRRLASSLRTGAMVYASSPNAAHWSIICNLVYGRFRYQPSGLMDKTHLRWFTPESYRALFEETGFKVISLNPIRPLTGKSGIIDALTRGRLRHLLMQQMMLVGRKAELR